MNRRSRMVSIMGCGVLLPALGGLVLFDAVPLAAIVVGILVLCPLLHLVTFPERGDHSRCARSASPRGQQQIQGG